MKRLQSKINKNTINVHKQKQNGTSQDYEITIFNNI